MVVYTANLFLVSMEPFKTKNGNELVRITAMDFRGRPPEGVVLVGAKDLPILPPNTSVRLTLRMTESRERGWSVFVTEIEAVDEHGFKLPELPKD